MITSNSQHWQHSTRVFLTRKSISSRIDPCHPLLVCSHLDPVTTSLHADFGSFKISSSDFCIGLFVTVAVLALFVVLCRRRRIRAQVTMIRCELDSIVGAVDAVDACLVLTACTAYQAASDTCSLTPPLYVCSVCWQQKECDSDCSTLWREMNGTNKSWADSRLSYAGRQSRTIRVIVC